MTASSVDFSKSMAPFTAFTRLGIKSWRRFNWTSICLNALSVWFLSETSPLYAPISQPTTTTSKARDRKSTRLNSSHLVISYAVFCLKKKASDTADSILLIWHPRRGARRRAPPLPSGLPKRLHFPSSTPPPSFPAVDGGGVPLPGRPPDHSRQLQSHSRWLDDL